MAANELVLEGVVMCDYSMKECQHTLEKRNKRQIDGGGLTHG